MAFDPGYVPKLGGLTEQKAVIDELLGLWKFDDQNFCVTCMVRMPLRSKHCKRCNRCVAKHDQYVNSSFLEIYRSHRFSHCPWVYNCVGVNNHRHFLLYLVFLEVGIALVVRLTIACESSRSVKGSLLIMVDYQGFPTEGNDQCNLLAPELCRLVNKDPYTLVLMIWAALQMTWVTMLLFVQATQISRAMTTYENMRGSHHSHGSRASEAITLALTAGTLSLDAAQLGSEGRGADPAVPPSHGHSHHHKEGCFGQWKKLLGVDTFVETLQGNSTTRRRNRNPFSKGCWENCKDFWCDPAPVFSKRENGAAMLGGEEINYTAIYETPLMMNARTRRGTDGGGVYQSVAADEAV